MSIDWDKPVQTRNGHKVRVLCTDMKAEFPVIVLIENEEGETLYSLDKDGRLWREKENELDIVNVPTTVTRWVNVYPDEIGKPRKSKQEANYVEHTKDRIACVPVKITYTSGEGLDD